jgi:predicted ABC-type ATPase
MEEREVKFWFSTSTGKHIPVFEGETKADAVKRVLGSSQKSKPVSDKKSSDDKKAQEIAKATENAKKLNDEQNYKDTLNKGTKVTVKNGKLMFNGKEIDKIDTKDAGTPGKDSFADNMKNGELTPERQEVHAQIIEDYFKEHQPYGPNEQKVAMFTGGGGASGKGQFTGTNGANVGKYYSQDRNPVIIDPDELKKSLAKADGRVIDDKLTGYYHEESSALAKQIYSTAIKNNYPALYDGTATGKGIYGLLDSAKQYGYKTEMNFICSDFKTVQMNSLSRYKNSGRLVPAEQLFGAHQKAYGAVTNLQDKFDSFTLWDNAGRNMQKIGTSSLGKSLTILNQESWDRFSNSPAEFILNVEKIDRYSLAASRVTKYREWKTSKKLK